MRNEAETLKPVQKLKGISTAFSPDKTNVTGGDSTRCVDDSFTWKQKC